MGACEGRMKQGETRALEMGEGKASRVLSVNWLRVLHIAPCGRTLKPYPLDQGPARCALDAYVPRLIISPSSLGRRKARYLAARFLTPPV